MTDPHLNHKYKKANARGRFEYRVWDTTIHITKNKTQSHIFDYFAENGSTLYKHFAGNIQLMQFMYVALGNYIRIWLNHLTAPIKLSRRHKTSRLYEVQPIDDGQWDEELDEKLKHLRWDERLEEIKRKEKSWDDNVYYLAEVENKYDIFIKITHHLKKFQINIEKKLLDQNPTSFKNQKFTIGYLSLDSNELRIMHRAIGDCLLHNPKLKKNSTRYFRKKQRTLNSFSELFSEIKPYHDGEVDSVSSESSDDEEDVTTLKSELQNAKTSAEFQRFRSEKKISGQSSGPKNRSDALENIRGESVLSYAAVDMWINFTKSTFTEKQASEIILLTTDFCSTLTKQDYLYGRDGTKLAENIDLTAKTIKLLIAPFRYPSGNWALLVAIFIRDNDDEIPHLNHIDIQLLEPETHHSQAFPIQCLKEWIKRQFKYRAGISEPPVYLGANGDKIEHFPKSLFCMSGKKQNDDGIFVCMYISYICSSVEMDFLPTDIKLLRKWVEFKLRGDASILPLDIYPPNIDKFVEEYSDWGSDSDCGSS